jgi:CheY-like chemotaxis protein
VIRNLILNAREAMPQGGVIFVCAENLVLPAQAQTSLPAGEYVRVSVTDQGPGLAPDVLLKIFDPYFSTKRRGSQKGMGLGLTICHAVMHKHKGAILVESKMGVGATFHLYLPATRKLKKEPEVSRAKFEARQGRILLMDDEDAVRRLMGLVLQRMGHEVELVADGERAIEAYQNAKKRQRPFDLVILDLMVPGGMGGEQTLQGLRQIDFDVKAIAMSGYAMEPILLHYERYGFQGALNKPFENEKLKELLARVLPVSAETKERPW